MGGDELREVVRALGAGGQYKQDKVREDGCSRERVDGMSRNNQG